MAGTSSPWDGRTGPSLTEEQSLSSSRFSLVSAEGLSEMKTGVDAVALQWTLRFLMCLR